MFCALLVFSGLIAAGVATMYFAQQQVEAQEQADQQNKHVAQQALASLQAAQGQQQQSEAYQRWLHERQRLQPDQRCIGGVVVQVRGNAYSQLGYSGQPAHCSGQYADQPTR